MTIRAIILGLLLGLGVAAATYFNDSVIRQTMLIGNHLPISVFGGAMILLLVVNPLLRLGGAGLPLRGGEIGIIVTLGLAACGWPGSGFFRGFDVVAGLPGHWLKTRANWQSMHVMSYVPGGSAQVGPGHVQDWSALLTALTSPQGEAQSVLASQASSQTRQMAARALDDGVIDMGERRRLLRAVNTDLIDPAGTNALFERLASADLLPVEAQSAVAKRAALLKEAAAELAKTSDARGESWLPDYLLREAAHWARHANRGALVGVMGESVVLPAPSGAEVLLTHGRADPYVVDTLVQGRSPDQRLSVLELPWRAWWKPIRVWWSLALLLGGATLCLALIVHPQWSRRELLPYPIPRFLEESVERREGAWLPEVARQRMFWVAFVALVVVHSINGLHAWFPHVPEIPLRFDFSGLRELFPTASRIWGSSAYFTPRLFLSVIAFSFFLTTSVSFSLGISQLLFLVLGSAMLMQGIPVENDTVAGDNMTLLRFGGYVGMGLMIAYTGRRYYANVLASSVGWSRASETPAYATWAARGLIVTTAGSVLLLRWVGLDWLMASLFVVLALLMYVVLSRIVAETGAFFVQATWLPVGVLTALLGFEAIGPTTYIVLALTSVMMTSDPREALMPYLVNGLRIADRTAGASPARVSPWLVVMVVASLVVAGTATLYFQYGHGMSSVDEWTKTALPTMSFNNLARQVSDATAEGAMAEAATAGPLNRFERMSAEPGAYAWLLMGLALVIGCAAARLRLPWWPLHPVAFLLWGTYPITQFAFSFLLGWLIKAAVVRTSGAKGYHTIKPLMVGIIAGELFAGLLWIGVGAAHYFRTGQPPSAYGIFPW